MLYTAGYVEQIVKKHIGIIKMFKMKYIAEFQHFEATNNQIHVLSISILNWLGLFNFDLKFCWLFVQAMNVVILHVNKVWILIKYYY